MVFDEEIENRVESCPASLARYLEDCLSECLMIDAVFCREAHARACSGNPVRDLNQQFSALRMAREPREASLAMGRRFASLAAVLHPIPALLKLAKIDEMHLPVAFGYTMGALEVDPDLAVGASLNQSVVNTISAAQRLLPLGQMQASRIAWQLKPAILSAVGRSREVSFRDVGAFAPLPETAAMRHPCLPTRLFIS